MGRQIFEDRHIINKLRVAYCNLYLAVATYLHAALVAMSPVQEIRLYQIPIVIAKDIIWKHYIAILVPVINNYNLIPLILIFCDCKFSKFCYFFYVSLFFFFDICFSSIFFSDYQIDFCLIIFIMILMTL